MNIADESLLSAYLDGELDSARRLMVESALEHDSRLADRLQQLARVRSLVGGMSRPDVGLDLVPGFETRVQGLPAVRYRRLLGSSPVRYGLSAFGGGLAAAAVWLVMGTVLRPVGIVNPPVGESRPTAIARTAPGLVNHRAGTETAEVAAIVEPRVVAVEPVLGSASPGERKPMDTDRAAVEELLSWSDVRRIVVVVDALSADELAKVEGAILKTGRRHPVRGEIRVGEGNVIDRAHPEAAVVYAMIMDDREADRFRSNLAAEMPGREVPVEAAFQEGLQELSQTADIRVVEEGAVAELTAPPETIAPGTALALKVEPSREMSEAAAGTDEGRGSSETHADEASLGEPTPDRATASLTGSPESGEAEVVGQDTAQRPRVYLVWVTTRMGSPPIDGG